MEGLGSRSECKSLGLGFGLFGCRKFGPNTETLNLAKVGLAKVGQHSEALKLAKVGWAKVGHDRPVLLGAVLLRPHLLGQA